MLRSAVLLGALWFVANATAQEAGRLVSGPGAMRLSEIIGMEVLTPEGRRLGTITDLYFDRANCSVEEVAVGAARYPVSSLLSGDAPGQVLVVPTTPIGKETLSRASREAGSADAVIVDLLQGRLRR
jgi:sporulation protein YlmC with PRC-barrel domain